MEREEPVLGGGSGVGVRDRLRHVSLEAARHLEAVVPASWRPQLRLNRILPRLIEVLCLLLGLGAIFYGLVMATQLLGREDAVNETVVLETEVSREVLSLNEALRSLNLQSSNLRPGAPNVQLHGDLSNPNLPADWAHPSFKEDLRFPLDRRPNDYRDKECRDMNYGTDLPSASVVFIFCNEPFETLLRSVHSVLNTSPPDLIDEIILVDDGSDAAYIRPREDGGTGLLEDYIKLLPKVRLIRTGERSGIVRARLTGIREVKSDVFVILDSHIEAQPGWLEPLLMPIREDPKTVVMPHIDGIDKNTFKLQKGGVGCTLGIIWNVMEHAYDPRELLKHPDMLNQGVFELNEDSPLLSTTQDRLRQRITDYVSSPTMAGGLFAANRKWFLEDLGGYDLDMSGWGAENVEFSFRLWMCHGKLLCSECSRVNHMFGGGKHYKVANRKSTTINRMRTIRAWMDEYADLSWHILGKPSFDEIGNMTRMKEIKRRNHCHDFRWFLDNVYPESYVRRVPGDVPFLGPMTNVGSGQCVQNGGRGSPVNIRKCSYASTSGQIYWRRPRYITVENNDETCLVAPAGAEPRWDWCHQNTHWNVTEVRQPAMLTAAKKAVYAEPRAAHIYSQELGELVLAQITTSDGRCLSQADDRLVLEACVAPASDRQLWSWTRYRLHDFWRQ